MTHFRLVATDNRAIDEVGLYTGEELCAVFEDLTHEVPNPVTDDDHSSSLVSCTKKQYQELFKPLNGCKRKSTNEKIRRFVGIYLDRKGNHEQDRSVASTVANSECDDDISVFALDLTACNESETCDEPKESKRECSELHDKIQTWTTVKEGNAMGIVNYASKILHTIILPHKIPTLAGSWIEAYADYSKNIIPRNRKGQVKRMRKRGRSRQRSVCKPAAFRTTLFPIPEIYVDTEQTGGKDNNIMTRKNRGQRLSYFEKPRRSETRTNRIVKDVLAQSSPPDEITRQLVDAVMSRDLEILKSVITVLEQSSSPKLNLKLLQTHACTTDGNTLLILAVIVKWNEGADFFCTKGWNVHQKNGH
eukprot:CAMPEP_0198295446 /NCGR_PEP_ID=MMETSP1449-20131203/27692_1 /TAXON_ID=420275 /ORGANISM="Attheya septentrionalis, Strain CCMP2084" /LENGTH=361 /DNA_ID=CAMNT_0043995753 /DNA_START=16 /DNA_END=1098 /DNA_ORIENTATION=+